MIFKSKNKQVKSPEEKKAKNKERLLLIFSGILMGLSFPPVPFPFTLLMFVGLIPYFKIIESKERLIDINRATYLMAFVFSAITTYWVGSWQKEADPFLMISGILLFFVNPAHFLVSSTLFYFTKKIFKKNISLYVFPLFWVTYEYVTMITDFRFPWITLGSGLALFNNFIQAADIFGSMGLSLVVIYINIFLYKAWRNYKISNNKFYLNLSTAVLIFILIFVYGLVRKSSYEIPEKKNRVGLIQPNINPWDKWQTGDLNSFLNLYLELSQKAVDEGAKLIIWPETAIPVYLMSGGHQSIVDSIYSFLEKNKVYLLTGMPDLIYHSKENHPEDAKYNESGDFYYTTYNAVLFLSPDSKEFQRYGKSKLVPFGEKVPYAEKISFLGSLVKWGVGLSGWNEGKDTTVFSMPFPATNKTGITYSEKDSLNINGSVCYESIFPDFVAQFVAKGAGMIAVVTNDSWYGKLSGPYQHKEFAALRAVENRRSVVRAANGGVSCIINPLGITETESKMFQKTFIVGDVVIEDEKTFFTNNPLIIPILSSTFSIWIFGIFLLKKMKDKFKL
ncbi:MAG TPA: apolipoprotein N-acyltransferase [Ignavibacteriaceae bacterium]|nr:apolipoprotein N-acyltransferase [Ignavibacteriaceae bacterium]